MGFVKDAAMWSISRGLRLPQPQLDRMAELFFLRNLLQQLQVDCVLDVGANRGQFASELRSIGYDGHIVSFEPLASEFAVMRQHFEQDAKWRGYQTALGSAESTVDIHVGGLTVMSSLLESVQPDRNASLETVTVKRLDSLLPGILAELGCARVFLKMDTQGYDLEVFTGSAQCMAPILGLQSELSVVPLYKGMPHYLEALQTYEAAGFELFNLSVVNRVADGGLLEMNCFMRRAEFGGLSGA
jgi:FkbM family methyltransferase